MRPGQVQPNEFELAVLNRIAAKDPAIGSINQLHVLSREFTGVGSFTNFVCPREGDERMFSLDDPIQMPGVPNGLGAVLYLKANQPKMLEIFTFGSDHWEGIYDGFSIESAA